MPNAEGCDLCGKSYHSSERCNRITPSDRVYFSTKFDGYKEVVLNAANNSDDTDTIAAISGAKVGIDNIPKKWVSGIELSSYLFSLAERIWERSETLEEVSKIVDSVTEADSVLTEILLDTHEEGQDELFKVGDIGVDLDEYEVEF